MFCVIYNFRFKSNTFGGNNRYSHKIKNKNTFLLKNLYFMVSDKNYSYEKKKHDSILFY